MSLKIASQCGLSLVRLLTGDLTGWRPPAITPQLVLALPQPVPKLRGEPHMLDWESIEA